MTGCGYLLAFLIKLVVQGIRRRGCDVADTNKDTMMEILQRQSNAAESNMGVMNELARFRHSFSTRGLCSTTVKVVQKLDPSM